MDLKQALYLDDRRIPTKTLPGDYAPWVVVKNYDEFIEYILTNGLPDFISFDHDLGDEHYRDHSEQMMTRGWQVPDYEGYTEKTGMDCAKWMCNYIQDILREGTVEEANELRFPTCSVHSTNPVGADNIQSYINGFKKFIGLNQDCFIMDHPFTVKEGSYTNLTK
jgi:hypothetical protein